MELAEAPNGRDGTLTAIREEAAGRFSALQTLRTAQGARTACCDPKTRCFRLPCNTPGETGAAGKFGLLVVGIGEGAPVSRPAAR